ncbi:MAG: hypothetical protein ACMXYL_02135 [Candidatus Woesearchaeota archaeon]
MDEDNLDSIVSRPYSIKSLANRLTGFFAGGVLALSLVGCPMNDAKNNIIEECPFNPAVEYALENNILVDYDVAGFGTYCFWNPVKDADKKPSSFLDPYDHNRTREMLDWMVVLDADEFYTHDQVQSLVTRFGEGIINPETGDRVEHDTGLVNVDEYYAAREFYKKAKEMHVWATANQHRAESIKPEHYKNFNAWSIRLFGWPYPEPEFQMPVSISNIDHSGLEPSIGFLSYGPVNWGVSDYGTPDYEESNFIEKEGIILGRDDWRVCKGNVEPGYASSQNFILDDLFLELYHGVNVLVQSMLYSPGTVLTRTVNSPDGVDYYDMTMSIKYPVSSTLMDVGGYVDGYRLTVVYAHISGYDGDMYDSNVPSIGDIILPRSTFAYLNSQRPTIGGDFQGYLPRESGYIGPYRPRRPERVQVDMFYEGADPRIKAGWNHPANNRHDNPANYATVIGVRTVFSPCDGTNNVP